eukprot:symbB.v1.2.009398.t1/scaffold531.1/size191016/10
MGANSCCFTSENVRAEAKADMMTDGIPKDDKHVQFSKEVAADSKLPSEVKTARTKDRKGTGYVKPGMFQDLVDEDED